MDLTIRDWMVIIGVLLITAVLLDAWRRLRSESYSRVKVKLAEPEAPAVVPERDIDLAWIKELPNGGARVIDRDGVANAPGGDSDAVQVRKERESKLPQPELRRPVDEVDLFSGMSGSGAIDGDENLDWLDGIGSGAEKPAEPPVESSVQVIDSEVFMLNVLACSSSGFRGEDILHILLACDLRFGDMNFFHRHELEAGRGAIQFSVANMMQPGIFDIDNMSDFNTPGLVFFLTLPGPEDMMTAFDYMLETAHAVARNLDGDVLDESRSALTKQSLEHCRQKIRDLERRMLAQTT
jgi:cell division protein ZipA